jgi:hypothetical protein
MDTFQALGVTLVAIMPGAFAVWAYEKQVGSWGLKSPERLYRLIAVSTVIWILSAPLTYWLWVGPFHREVSAHSHIPSGYWLIFVGYAIVPAAIGALLGYWASKRDSVLQRFLRGTSHSPSAWEAFFCTDTPAIIRIKLKSGTWMAGVYGDNESLTSYASGYPDPGSLLLTETVAVDPLTGAYVLDVDSQPTFQPLMILIDSTEIEYLIIESRK